MTCSARMSACWNAHAACSYPSIPSSATRAPASPSGSSAPRSTAPRWSTPTATTCAAAAPRSAVPVLQLLREIRDLGYQGSANLLVRYITQGRVEADRPHLSPRRAARLVLTRPASLTPGQHQTLSDLAAACPEMTELTGLVSSFAALLTPDPGNGGLLAQWITTARAADLPHLHAFSNGLDLDMQAATAALTLPHHNGRTEGVNTKTKMISARCTAAPLRPPAPPDPARLTPRTSVTTESATEPVLQWILPGMAEIRGPGPDRCRIS